MSKEHTVAKQLREGDDWSMVLVPIDHVLEQKLDKLSLHIGQREIRRPDQILRALLRLAEKEYRGVKVAYDDSWYTAVESVWERLSGGIGRRLDWGEALKQIREIRKDEPYINAHEGLLGQGDRIVGQERFAKILELYEHAALKGLELEQELRERFEHLGMAVSRGGLGGGIGYALGVGLIEMHQQIQGHPRYTEQQRQRYKTYRDEVLERWGGGQAVDNGQELRDAQEKVHVEAVVRTEQNDVGHSLRGGEHQELGLNLGADKAIETGVFLDQNLGERTPSSMSYTAGDENTGHGRARVRQRDRSLG